MKSKAHFKSHPIHPILVAFPIAFLVGGFLAEAAGYLLDNGDLQTVAGYLIISGIVAGLLAAVPGIMDFAYTIPPESSAKKRGVQHGILNVTVLIVFACAWTMREGDDVNYLLVLGLELVGVILLTMSGWLGGTLVYRNQIGIDIRYAGAGKWSEVSLPESKGRVEVARRDDLETNQIKLIHINHKRIVLGRTENGYAAFDDRCTHRGGSLAGGVMICGTVQCPWHGSQFDVLNGQVKAGPAKEAIKVYKVEEEGGKVFIIL
jgi:uncharacterized membrane protein/nitrite reductase/ring-hydroxylating ferredoxin subunit